MAPKSVFIYHHLGDSLKSIPLYYIPVVLFSFAIAFIVKRRYLSPLRRFPGPFWASVTRWWLVREIFRGDHEKNMLRLHAKYGPIVRISPFEVAISDPHAIKVIYGHTSGFIKSEWYDTWWNRAAGNPSLFAERDERAHAIRRRNVANAYSMTTVVQLEEYVDSCSTQILKQFERLADSGPIKLCEWLQMYAFDVVGELAFGKKFGFLEEGRDIGWMAVLEDITLGNTWVGEVPYMTPIVRHPLVQNLVPRFRKQTAALGRLAVFAKSCVSSRLDRGSGDRKDMLTYTLEAHRKRPDVYTQRDLTSDAYTIVFAGSETTAIALRSIFYHILKDPQVYAKLQAEIDQADAEGKLSPSPTFSETHSLPYLVAVIREATRIHPSVQLCMPRIVPSSGATICGEYFPPGTIVGCNPYIIHRNTSIFGPDAEIFRPERWLDTERAKEMDKYIITFGAGNRTCIGKNISLMEMQKLVSQLLRYFDFELEDREMQWKTMNRWFNSQKGLFVTIRPRRKVDLVPVWQNLEKL